MKALKMQTA